MYVILQSLFDRERRDRVASHLQKFMAQSGMAVHRQDTQDVVEIAASAVRTIFEMNGAAEVIDNPEYPIQDLLFRGADKGDNFSIYSGNTWLSVSKKKADEVLSRWNDQELLTAAIITARNDECSLEKWPFENVPHIILKIAARGGKDAVHHIQRGTRSFESITEVAPAEGDIDEGLAFAAYRIFKARLIHGFKG